jgi:hypothetical protein
MKHYWLNPPMTPPGPRLRTMTKAIKEAGRKTDPAVLKHIDRCAMFLIKALCLDND